MQIGANYRNKNCEFTVWAPYSKHVSLVLVDKKETLPMNKAINDYWTLNVRGLTHASEYMYQLDRSKVKPDPASYFQPKGVFGPSAIVNHEAFKWTDKAWTGLELADLLFYELHVGTFTEEGTFKAIMSRVKELADFGINAIELMPMAQFSGQRGWGYDTVFPYAVQNSYGNPNDLKALVNYCHKQDVAVFIDVVYNHIGPEGNCLNDYGPYFLAGLKGRWGPTANLDGPLSEPVRNYFLQNTLYWLKNYHLDGIRYDAVLFMEDKRPKHFLQELNEEVKNFSKSDGRKIWLIAESGYNEPRVLKAENNDGFGFDAQWLDDFQHAVHALLTSEKEGYYRDYGRILDLVEILRSGYVYVGMHDYHRRNAEEVYTWISPCNLIVFSQNHDQVGNRLLGERLITLAGFEAAKLAAGITILSPYIPLFFMGEEYGEVAPFLFFADYLDKELAIATKEGRKKEFSEFHWKGEVPDPSAIDTFEKSKIDWQLRHEEKARKIMAYYEALIKLRKQMPKLCSFDKERINIFSNFDKILFFNVKDKNTTYVIIANFDNQKGYYEYPFEGSEYIKVLDSAAESWNGPGATLPERTKENEKHEILGFDLAVYLKMM